MDSHLNGAQGQLLKKITFQTANNRRYVTAPNEFDVGKSTVMQDLVDFCKKYFPAGDDAEFVFYHAYGGANVASPNKSKVLMI
jgi:hypothetical protein